MANGQGVLVSDAGSRWHIDGVLGVGSFTTGSGSLNVLAGGIVEDTDAFLAGDPSGIPRALATVGGTGSTWTNSGNLFVGLPDDQQLQHLALA